MIPYLFNNISDDEKKRLEKLVTISQSNYLRDETIVFENDLCNSIKLVKIGTVVAKNTYYDGHENIIKIINANDTFGEALIFSSNPYYKATFIATNRVTIESISIDDINKLIKANPTVNINLFKRISDSLIVLNNHIKILNKKTIRGRLLLLLYYEYKKRNATTFTIGFNKTELADFLNVERPSLSRELSILIKEGIIANKNHTYTIINLKKIEPEL